jgi:hypothetical protein
MANSGNEAIKIIGGVLEVAQQYQLSYDEQIELWAEFLVAGAEMSALAERLMEERGISRPKAIELAFEQNPIGLKELIKKVNPDKYCSYMENMVCALDGITLSR